MTLRARLALYGAGVVALTVLLFGVVFYALVAYSQTGQRDALLKSEAGREVVAVHSAAPDDLQAHRTLAAVDLRTSSNVFVEILDGQGRVLSSTGTLDGSAPAVPAAELRLAAARGSAVATLRSDPRVPVRVFVQPWSRPDLGLEGYVAAGQPLRVVQSALGGLRVLLVVAALLSLFAALAVNWFVPGRALRPLKLMTRTAEEIGRTQDLSRRLPTAMHRDEVSLLTASFNSMLTRLEQSQRELGAGNRRLEDALNAQRRFVADASHELRTPLTSIRTNAGFLLHQPEARSEDSSAALQDIADESERMSRLVQDLLTLARADAGQRLERAPVDLAGVVRSAWRQAEKVYPDRRLYLDVAAEALVAGNADALAQLLWILIDNAAKHTEAQGQIWLGVAWKTDAVELRVADDGGGIPEAGLDRIFERFYQSDGARSGGGAGLGLAIASWIVRAHGGQIWAVNNTDSGATFSVRLPAEISPNS